MMDLYKLQQMVRTTECDQEKSKQRLAELSVDYTRLLHSVVGLTGEVGELATAIERHLFYGGECDEANIIEELGDCLWYIVQGCLALHIAPEVVVSKTIAKLSTRYKERTHKEIAEETNRDRVAEQRAMKECVHVSDYARTEHREQTGAGWAEPMEEDDCNA